MTEVESPVLHVCNISLLPKNIIAIQIKRDISIEISLLTLNFEIQFDHTCFSCCIE